SHHTPRCEANLTRALTWHRRSEEEYGTRGSRQLVVDVDVIKSFYGGKGNRDRNVVPGETVSGAGPVSWGSAERRARFIWDTEGRPEGLNGPRRLKPKQ
ncbi:uncharacterized, partial [Tachysurus ichikawai]